jgi:hypothetical protein
MRIEEQIQKLLTGKRFSEADRVRDLVRLFFLGDGEVALHARCLVRLMREDRLVASSADTAGPTIDIESGCIGDFQWDEGFTAYDFDMKGYLKRAARPVVREVSILDCGDLVIHLNDGAEIQVLTASARSDREQWRVFRWESPVSEAHIVCYPAAFCLE